MTPTVTDDFISFSPFSVDPCETIQVKRYKSSKTGLTAVHADVEGNDLYFILQTLLNLLICRSSRKWISCFGYQRYICILLFIFLKDETNRIKSLFFKKL